MLRKKSLGQHFLNSSHYLKLIADSADIKRGEMVLEVGPGEGALTAELLSRGACVVSIEKDSRLIPILKEKFSQEISEKRFSLHEADILEFDAANLFEKNKYKVVANIPYYITGALLKKFLSGETQPSSLVLFIQKEVAQRIVGNPDATRSGPRPKRRGKESILSLSIKVYGDPVYVKTVPRGAFSPPPTVDSAIIKITNVSRKNFNSAEEERKFFALVRAGFAQKRKLLKRNLESVLGTEALTAMQKAGIPEDARAEDVALEQWLALVR